MKREWCGSSKQGPSEDCQSYEELFAQHADAIDMIVENVLERSTDAVGQDVAGDVVQSVGHPVIHSNNQSFQVHSITGNARLPFGVLTCTAIGRYYCI